MIIKKIIIKNYKQLDLEMKLVPNSNGFEKNERYFEYLENIPKIIGIGGTNAIGKTSIIEVFNLISKHKISNLNIPFVVDHMMNDPQIIKKISSVKSKSFEINKIKDKSFILERKFLDYSFKNFYSKKMDKVFVDSYWKAMEKFYISQYKEFARNFKKDIEFKFEIINEIENNQLYELLFAINGNGSKILIKQLNNNNLKPENMKKTFDKFVKSISFNFQTFFDLNSYYKVTKKRSINIDYSQNLEIGEILKNNLKNKELKFILKQMDPEIRDIYLEGKEVLIKIGENKTINWWMLSAGTKKMIEFFDAIKNPNKDIKFLFIDELEKSLNNKLINFIKKYIYKSSKIQLFFTSHSGSTLWSFLDNKQIFLLEKDLNEEKEEVTKSWKFSSRYSNNNSFRKMFDSGKLTSFGDQIKIINILNRMTENEAND